MIVNIVMSYDDLSTRATTHTELNTHTEPSIHHTELHA